jgi:hypothetical protein
MYALSIYSRSEAELSACLETYRNDLHSFTNTNSALHFPFSRQKYKLLKTFTEAHCNIHYNEKHYSLLLL